MNPDTRLSAGLARMKAAIDGLLAIETRSAATNKLNADKLRLDAQWQADLKPVLEDLYWHPLRNGINEAPDNERSLRRWLREQLSTAAAVAALLALLLRYQQRAATLGGQVGLMMLGLDAEFNLTNPAYLAQQERHANRLVTAGSDINVIDTTVDDLVQYIPQAKEDDDDTAVVLAALIAARVLVRIVTIERTERPRQVANGLNWTFLRNNVRLQMYDINGEGCPQICEPLHGRIMAVNNIPAELSLPRHPSCDCIYTAVTADWNPPPQIWTGGA